MTTLHLTMSDDAFNAPEPGTESLASLAAGAASGDQSSFERLHRRLSGGLLRLFRERTGGRADLAEDFSQRTWSQVWQALRDGKYDPSRAAISTFIYAVGHRVWLQHLRSKGRADAREAELRLRAEDQAQKDDTQAAESIDAVRACLRGDPGTAGLSEEERWILRASASGITDRELAQRLRIAPSTANDRKKAAYEKLRRYLESRGHRQESPERTRPTGE
jgi:RNA polymerase sigma factor (sigma-70 family)